MSCSSKNSPIVNMGDKLVLFDTGMGTSQAFGPTTGRRQQSMKEAGIKPEDIDAVVLIACAYPTTSAASSMPTTSRLFPNAQYYIAQSDLEFWTE